MAAAHTRKTETFQLNVDGHGKELSHRLNSARKEWRFCDFVIRTGSKKIPVHRVVLCEGSDYFRELFSRRDGAEDSHDTLPYVALDGIDPECLLICIEYLYTGQISMPKGKCLTLLVVANTLKLKGLCDRIVAFLESNLDVNLFYQAQRVASTSHFRTLAELCHRFTLRNFRSIVASDEFVNMDKSFVINLIRDRANEEQEFIKCKALMVWGNYDYYNRKDDVEKIFLTLNSSSIPKVYLQYLEENEPLVFDSVSCMRKLFRAMSQREIEVHPDPAFQAILSNWSELQYPWPEKFYRVGRDRRQRTDILIAKNTTERRLQQASATDEQVLSSALKFPLSPRFKTLLKLMDFCLDVSKVNAWRISIDYESRRIWDEVFDHMDGGVLIHAHHQDVEKRTDFEEFLKSEKVIISGKEWKLSDISRISFECPSETGVMNDQPSSHKLVPGFVIWFDNENLELIANNFCDFPIEFCHSCGIDPKRHSKIVSKSESCAIFSIEKFVDMLQKKPNSMYRLDGFDITTPNVATDGLMIRINPCMIYRFAAVLPK